MKIAATIAALWIFSVSAYSQDMLARKEIYRVNREAVVQIGVGSNFSGDGFVVSADGVVVTANHVVTTRESKFHQYANGIQVRVVRNGIATIYPATPIEGDISDDQVNFDSVKLKITATGLNHVTLGNWDEIDIGSEVEVLASFPGPDTLMLEGPVSGKAAARSDLGPKPVNTVWFQCPVHNGFSGAPIFSSKGHVIGIVDTKVFGIAPALDQLRTEWAGFKGGVRMGNIDISGTFVELINNLDKNLVSGLGSGVDIAYAEQQENRRK
jgi:S1-C subfamily serine protease